MTAEEWLRTVAMTIGAGMNETRRFTGMAPRLRSDFPDSALTATTAQDVTEGLRELPTYPELRKRLEAFGPFDAPPRQDDEAKLAQRWQGFIAKRMAEGGDSDNLLSLARTYIPPAYRDRALEALFPAWWRRELAYRNEIRAAKAARAANAPGWVAGRLAPPKAASGAPAASTAYVTANPSRVKDVSLSGDALVAFRKGRG